MKQLYLSTAYWAPVSYYAAIFRHNGATIEQYDTYVKQTYRNRCHIIGPAGVQALTIPVVKPAAGTPTRDILISEHGNWRHLHRMAIASAYGSSPFYEYYADDINRFYDKPCKYLLDYNLKQIECVCNWIERYPAIACSTQYSHDLPCDTTIDLRDAIHPKHPDETRIAPYLPRPYYQVFEAQTAFVCDASILDLLCNMGNESLLVLLGIAS